MTFKELADAIGKLSADEQEMDADFYVHEDNNVGHRIVPVESLTNMGDHGPILCDYPSITGVKP